MDISKLPRLSQTAPPPAGTADPAEPTDSTPTAPPRGFEPVMTTSAPTVGYCACGAPLRAGARFCDSCGAPVTGGVYGPPAAIPRDAGVGAEVWLSVIIGLVLMLLGRSFGLWLFATATGGAYHTNVNWTDGERAGQEVRYWELDGFTALNDSAIFLFGLAMVLEGAVLALVASRFQHKAPVVRVALAITIAATGYNLFVAAKLLTANTLPLLSLLAVGFGGYIAVFEWRLLQQLSPRADSAAAGA